MINIYVKVQSSPDTITGFHDTVKIEGVEKEYPCSASPNGEFAGEHWSKRYGWIGDGSWVCKVVKHPKYGKCILVNNGYYVPSVVPNVNHNNEMVMNSILFHEANKGGNNPEWRGSAGCLTMHRELFKIFMNNFRVGELIKLHVNRS